MSESQAVAPEPNEEVMPPSAEVDSAQAASDSDADLDTVLKEVQEFEEKDGEKPPIDNDESTTNDDRINDVLEYVKRQKIREQELEAKALEEEYGRTVKSLKGDLPVSEKMVDAFLRLKASEDTRVLKAYQMRNKSPEVWQKVERGLRNEIRKEINALPDVGATQTRNQIAAAIQSAQSTTDEVPQKKLSEMDDVEFYEYQQKLFGA